MSVRKNGVLFGLAIAVVATAVGWREVVRGRAESASPAGRLRAELKRTPVDAHQQIFAAYLQSLGAKGILDVLEKEYPYCHSQAHPLGRAVFAANGDLRWAIDACAYRCSGGCLHGVLTEALKQFATSSGLDPNTPATFEQLAAHGRDMCGRPEMTAHVGDCAHGVGHAFTFLAGYRMPQAIAGCRTFADDHLQRSCATGAYMERDAVLGDKDAVNPSPWTPCQDEAEFSKACYRYKVRHLFAHGRTLESVAGLCLSLPPSPQIGCFHGLGYAQWQNVARFPESLHTICRFGGRDDQVSCIEGAIYTLANQKSTVASAACAALPSDLSEPCQQAVRDGAVGAF